MHPYLFRVPLPWGGRFTVASYGAMILCGFLVSLWLLRRRGRRMGMDPSAVFDAATLALLGGIVGARLFYVVHHWEAFADNLWQIIRIDQGGLTFQGGLIGGAAGLLGCVWIKKLPLLTTLDVFGSTIPLGHAFGRIGCFLNGCCFGKLTHWWVGVRFPHFLASTGEVLGSPPFLHHLELGLITEVQTHSLPVHPTQLYAVAYNLLIFALLSHLLWRRRRPGETVWLYLILYGTARFANEFFRVTPSLPSLGGLTVFQAISAAAAVFGLVMLLNTRRRPRVPLPAPWVAPGEPDQPKKRS